MSQPAKSHDDYKNQSTPVSMIAVGKAGLATDTDHSYAFAEAKLDLRRERLAKTARSDSRSAQLLKKSALRAFAKQQSIAAAVVYIRAKEYAHVCDHALRDVLRNPHLFCISLDHLLIHDRHGALKLAIEFGRSADYAARVAALRISEALYTELSADAALRGQKPWRPFVRHIADAWECTPRTIQRLQRDISRIAPCVELAFVGTLFSNPKDLKALSEKPYGDQRKLAQQATAGRIFYVHAANVLSEAKARRRRLYESELQMLDELGLNDSQARKQVAAMSVASAAKWLSERLEDRCFRLRETDERNSRRDNAARNALETV